MSSLDESDDQDPQDPFYIYTETRQDRGININ